LFVVYKESSIAETVALWDVADVGHPKVVRTYKIDNEVHAVFSPDGRLLAIGSIHGPDIGDKTVVAPTDRNTRLWDVTDRRPIRRWHCCWYRPWTCGSPPTAARCSPHWDVGDTTRPARTAVMPRAGSGCCASPPTTGWPLSATAP
jgi:WD40 repeat protein